MNCQKRHNRGSGSRYCNLNFQINFRQFSAISSNFSPSMDYQQILHVSSNCVISQQTVRMLSHLISSLIIYCLIVEDSPWLNSFKLVSKGNVSGLLLKESKINTAAGAGSLKYLSLGIIRSRRCQSPVDTPRGEPFISFDEHFK